MLRLKKLLSLLIPLGKTDKVRLVQVGEWLNDDERSKLRYLLVTKKVRFALESFGSGFVQDPHILTLAANSSGPKVKAFVDGLNSRLEKVGRDRVFADFAPDAEKRLLPLVAPDIIGLDEIKRACLFQLFSKEKLHVLLLGDPSTGKTVVLRSISELAPKSSFGLGSGASKAGLTVSFVGKQMSKGLLPQADEGIACIDELNLLKDADRAGLLNAMEKGFITYDKGANHVQLDARVKVLASANPTGDKFIGKTISLLKKQVPFEPALLSRFHVVFLVRRPDEQQFAQIAKNLMVGKPGITENDLRFVKAYVEHALGVDVEFDKSLSGLVEQFVRELRRDEDSFLVEVTPRTVVGIVSLAKASARLRLERKVTRQDVIKALEIVESSLRLKKSI